MIGKGWLLTVGWLVGWCVWGQPSDYRPTRRIQWLYEEARRYFERYQHDEARALLSKLFARDSLHPEANELAAELALREGNDSLAAAFYGRVVRHFPDRVAAWYNLGQAAFGAGHYRTAAAAWDSFLVRARARRYEKYRQWAQEKIRRARFADSLRRHPVEFHPRNLGPAINTPHDEYWPVLTGDEQQLYFTRRIPIDTFELHRRNQSVYRRSQEDIYVSTRTDSGWATAKPAPGSLNTDYNEGAITLSPDGRYLIFTGCNWPQGYGSCDLYYSQRVNGRWSKPRNLGSTINTPYKETQPSLSADGTELFFSSNRPGGRGGLDIWVSRRGPRGQWMPPQPLDSPVNTPANEQAPFIHYDGRTLYFSSRGHFGLGRSDLYVARRRSDGRFDSVRNLGYPINTHKDELSLYVSAVSRTAYLSSEASGFGGLDIFSFEMPEATAPHPTIYVKGQVIDARTRKGIPRATLEFYTLPEGATVLRLQADEHGHFLTTLPMGSDYGVHVAGGARYVFRSIHLPLRNYQSATPYERIIPLAPLVLGASFDLHNVFFDFDSDRLRPASRKELDRVVRFLQRHPTVRIRIVGHTDSQGTAEYNLDLSLRRARSVKRYLVTEGRIDPRRIETAGEGESRPIASNATEAGRAQNRRIEIQIVP